MEDFIKKVLEWDVVTWSPVIAAWEKKLGASQKNGKALELGGRRGGLSLWLASKGYEVWCSDLENPEQLATPLHREFGFTDKIHYLSLDATDLPYEEHFDVIAFKSILGGIGRGDRPARQQQVIDQAHKALKKGGLLLFAENLTASPVHRFFRKKFVKWGDSWRYVEGEELKNFLAGFSAVEINTTGFAGAFGRSETQRRVLGKMDRAVLNALVPHNWHYVGYGWAMK